MSNVNYNELQLKSEQKKQIIGNTNLYYSLVKKDAKTLSFLSNERLLIYDDNRQLLYYINDFKNTPFRDKVPNPKNQFGMPIKQCVFSNPASTNNLLIWFTIKNSKGELQTTEWTFTFDSNQLTKLWINLLQNQKNKMVEKETGEKGVGFMHDVLMKNVQTEPNIRQTILKPEEEVLNYMILPEESQLRNSRLSDPKRSQVQPNNPIVSTSQLRNTENNDPQRTSEIKNTPVIMSGIRQNESINNSGLRNQERPIGYSGLKSQQGKRSDINNQELRFSATKNDVEKPLGYSYSGVNNSNLKPPGSNISRDRQPQPKQNSNDWNKRFLKQSTEATIYEYQRAAMKALLQIWRKDELNIRDPLRVYESQGLRIAVSNCFTKEAMLLKRQFRNYHFILDACKTKIVVGVPLCCLIQWEGIVALVKAPLPKQAEEVKLSKVGVEVRELQRYTRISNSALQKATLWDLTNVYGPNGDKKLIYVDRLNEYLPIHLDEEMNGASIRPEYLLDNVGQIIPGGDGRGGNRQQQKQLLSIYQGLSGCMKELAQHLNSQQTLWADALELKQQFHNFGINFKLLPRVYQGVGSKQVKKCLESVMVAKVAKDHLYEVMLQSRKQDNQSATEKIVEDFLRMLMQGGTSLNNQIWKEISLKFKKQYSTPLSNSELIPGFFLNSLIKLLRVKVDMSKFNKSKKMFKEEGIITEGFVVGIDPKVKSYYRFTTQFLEKIIDASRSDKKDREIYNEIVEQLQLNSRSMPAEYNLNNHYQPFFEYLSYYTPPSELDQNAPLKTIPIYQTYLKQPPTAFSLKITKAYLEWAIKKEKNDEFKKGIQEALKIADFWLEEGHIYNADLFQLLSDFYSNQNNHEQSINFMKEALSKTIRACGTQSRKAGIKYYELGERELKAGRKKEALDNFNKAKMNMLTNKNSTIKFPLLLMRIASLHLNSGNIQGCIEESLQSIKKFDEYDIISKNVVLTEGYKVKTFQVLARAYEISGRRVQLKELAFICAKKFNKCKTDWSYEQMIRICLAATIFNNSTEKCTFFLGFCQKIQKQEQAIQPANALKDLMALSESLIVMQKFMTRFESIERIAGERASRKPMSPDTRDFILICTRLTAVVGEDYIQGLVQQKQYQ